MKFKRILCLTLCVAMLLSLTLCFSSCAEKGRTLIKLDDSLVLTENQFQFLLSRAKANYEGTIKDWDTLMSLDGTTYDLYVRRMVLEEAKLLLAGAALFEKEGLRLPDETVKSIETDIKEFIEYHGEGSKSAFNSILSEYGFNVDMLKEQYILEAKYEYVQTYLYGKDGSKLASSATQEYLKQNAVAFKQLLIRPYTYVYAKDLNGDLIYYLPGENDGQSNNIAYDTIHGNTRTDEFGEVIKDKNGDKIYYTENGRIAYDTEKGQLALTYDAQGKPMTQTLSKEELEENMEIAEDIVNTVQKGDYVGFDAAVKEYLDTEEDKFHSNEKICFLYTTGDNGDDYLNDIADELAKLETGATTYISSDYGYHVVMRYEIPNDATSNKDYKDWFTDLNTRVVQYLFRAKCKDLMEQVTVDAEVFAAIPSMKDISANYRY